MSNTKVKSNKTQSFMTQRERTHTRKPQPKHDYMYTRHNNHKHVAQHNVHKHVTQTYQNIYFHCQCMSYTMAQKSYKTYSPPQHIRHVSHTRKAYHPRRNVIFKTCKLTDREL